MTTSDRVELRAGERSGVRLSRVRGGERTWALTLVDVADADELRAIVRELVELDRELEDAYADDRPAPRVHQPPRDDEPGEVF
jgi:hypothetical protein